MQDTNIPWTEAELKILASSLTHGEVAEKTGRSYTAVRVKRKRLGFVRGDVMEGVAEPDKTPDKKADYWRTECGRLQKQLVGFEKIQTATEILVDEARALAPMSYSPAPACRLLKKVAGGSPQSAVLLFSDTHIGKVVEPSQTLDFGAYNFDIFLRRLKRLEDSISSILSDHVTTEVPELVIAMLGDLLDGALVHSVEAGQVNTLFTQFYNAGHAIAQFLRNLSALVPSIRIYTACGNHPRWQNQHKMPTTNRYSNLDHFLYAYVAALVRDIPKISFTLNSQPMCEFDVQGFHFLGLHGDTCRGGDKALGLPAHSIGRQISFHSQLHAKFGRPLINYFVAGHVHRPFSLPHATGEWLFNGGWPGPVDGFGLAEAFVPADPIQKFFLVHKRFGRSCCYDLNLKFAKLDGPTPYDLPSEFPIV